MVVFSQTGDVIAEPNLDAGKLVPTWEQITWHYKTEVEGQGHYKTVCEYPNGGKDVEWVVDVPEKGHWEAFRSNDEPVDLDIYDGEQIPEDFWDKTEKYNTYWAYDIYIPYTDDELAQIAAEKAEAARLAEIEELKAELAETDYVVIKIAEYKNNDTELPEEDSARYAAIIKQRQEWRDQINSLEAEAALSIQ